jgi:ribose 5-phosphate isomerase B
MKIHMGADHAGYLLKEELKKYITELGHETVDHGAFTLDVQDDYPDFVEPVAQAVSQDETSMGIVLGGSGQGEAMNANRFEHVRAIEYYGGDLEMVTLGREHNNANVLSLGARFVTEEEARQAVKLFLETDFSHDERHVRRLEKIDDQII